MSNTPKPQPTALATEVKTFFANSTAAEIEQDLYDMLQLSLEHQPDVQHTKEKLHTYRELSQFLHRISQMV
jgi:DICT domain-containing protein